ncbi:hypothetical protein DYU11_11220 [Fibrisoma montanum]|uniref:Uncharacterized protein n=2 Tax=Fibrisoma montanum TaxID=2305895 RepID=A0A418MB27_9BACT|nr:hypothetical protein DYU11_11220 [Fibrisoma montanum]
MFVILQAHSFGQDYYIIMFSRIVHTLCALLLIYGCRSQAEPFETKLAGYTINLPVTSGEIRAKYPNAKESLFVYLTETTSDMDVEWRFNQSIYNPKSQAYAIIVTLRNKAHQMDSIRTALEAQYKKPFEPLLTPKHLGKYEYYEKDSTLGVLQVNEHVQLSIHRRKIWPLSGYQYTKDVVVSICYGLTDEQKERFAMKQGDIQPRD